MENIQEQPEVLIARNNETGQVGAVVGQNPDGTPRMADAKTAKLSDLVKFNKHQNPLEAFMSNFLRQAKNPSLFGFFKIPADQFDKIGPAMSDMLQNPVANADLLKPFKVDVNATAQTQEQTAQQEQKPATGIKLAPVNPDNIDWTTIEKQWGINRETLEQSGALQQMVYNRKSPQTFTLHPNFAVSSLKLMHASRSSKCLMAASPSRLTSSRMSLSSMCPSKGMNLPKKTRNSF
jgi:hypothetical protein